jgi:RNA polymerase-binding transcription factor DksA
MSHPDGMRTKARKPVLPQCLALARARPAVRTISSDAVGRGAGRWNVLTLSRACVIVDGISYANTPWQLLLIVDEHEEAYMSDRDSTPPGAQDHLRALLNQRREQLANRLRRDALPAEQHDEIDEELVYLDSSLARLDAPGSPCCMRCGEPICLTRRTLAPDSDLCTGCALIMDRATPTARPAAGSPGPGASPAGPRPWQYRQQRPAAPSGAGAPSPAPSSRHGSS